MANAQAWLETYSGGRACMSLVFDGIDAVYTTLAPGSSDLTTFATNWAAAGDPWSQNTVFKSGLNIAGEISHKIQLFAPELEVDSLDVTIQDDPAGGSGSLAESFLRAGYSSGARTYLTTALAAGFSGTVNAKDTTDFAASGEFWIGHSHFTYSGKTATTFTGVVGGINAIFQTNDADAFAPGHRLPTNSTGGQEMAPAITSFPRTWHGRMCTLYLHVWDSIAGSWSDPETAARLYVGRVESWKDNGNGAVTISISNAMGLLNRQVLGPQWSAKVNEGIYVTSATDTVVVYSSETTSYRLAANMTFDVGSVPLRLTHAEVAEGINRQFNTWEAGGSLHANESWRLTLAPDPDDAAAPPRYVLSLRNSSGTIPDGTDVHIALPGNVWNILGFTQLTSSLVPAPTTGDQVKYAALWRESGNNYWIRAEQPPGIYWREQLETINETVEVSSEVGTWVDQPAGSVNALPASEGCVELGGEVYAVAYSTGQLKIHAILDKATGNFIPPGGQVGTPGESGWVRLGEATEAPTVRQVWYENGSADAGNAGTVLLRLLLSTGASGYNHGTYDVYTGDGMGIGVPASLVNVESWEALNDVSIRLLLTEPTPFYKILEPVLQVSHRYVVWRSASQTAQPKLSIVRPSYESAFQATWQLTEGNKADVSRTVVTHSADGIINQVVVKFLTKEGADAKFLVENVASQSDHGKKRKLEIDCPMVINAVEMALGPISVAMAYFSRPVSIATRSINATLHRMAPGDSCSLVDNYVLNPRTGVRGATIYAWCLSKSFDFSTGQGRAELVFLPEKDPNRTAPWAPSLLVSSYNAGTKTITASAHTYSDSTEAADYSYFANGAKVHWIAIDDTGVPSEGVDTIASGGGTASLVLTTGIAGYSSSKTYVLEYDDMTTSATGASGQLNYAYIADDADASTGYSTAPDPFEWGVDEDSVYLAETVDYDTGMYEPGTSYDDKGEPLSVHKVHDLILGMNSLNAYKTCNVYVNECYSSSEEASVTGTTPGLAYVTWVPLYGHVSLFGIRPLKATVRMRQSGGGTATAVVVSTPHAPISYASAISNGNYNPFTSTSATDEWKSEASITPSPSVDSNGMWGTWISVYIYGSAGGITAKFNGITVREAPLP